MVLVSFLIIHIYSSIRILKDLHVNNEKNHCNLIDQITKKNHIM